MNKIIKELRITGYETITIIKPRNSDTNKEGNGIQLSLNIGNLQSTNLDQVK